MKVSELEKIFEELAPTYLKEDFDNVGLMVGDEALEVNSILVALDCTKEVIDEAKELECNLIYTHHPLLFRKPSSITTKTLLGTKIIELIRNDIALYSAHTNLDSIKNGLNDTLVELLGFEEGYIIDLNKRALSKGLESGIGRLVELKEHKTLKELLQLLKSTLEIDTIRYCGALDKKIENIAVINGSGSDYFAMAKELGADAIITGDTTYHYVSDYNEEGISIIDISHFDSEWPSLKVVAKKLEKKLQGYNVKIHLSTKSKNPYKSF